MDQDSDPNAHMLAALLDHAENDGADRLTLRALVEEASELGAARALARCGLHDASAGSDIYELRRLLVAWRDARKTVRRTVIAWLVRLAITALLVGLLVKFRLMSGLGPH